MRNTRRARELNTRAVAAINKGSRTEAEKLLKDALSIDIGYGPAHNNLGTVYYHQGDYYQAAWEYQYAIKLLPKAAEPHSNLGLVYEVANKLDDAANHYRNALELEPSNLLYIGNLARALVRQGKKDRETKDLLQKIVDHDTRAQWVQWARERLCTTGE